MGYSDIRAQLPSSVSTQAPSSMHFNLIVTGLLPIKTVTSTAAMGSLLKLLSNLSGANGLNVDVMLPYITGHRKVIQEKSYQICNIDM